MHQTCVDSPCRYIYSGRGAKYKAASGQGNLFREGHEVEEFSPAPRDSWLWISPAGPAVHAWTDGSFRKSAGLGRVIIEDDQGAGTVIAQGSKTLPGRQVAFDAEITVIEEALK
jgi:hypothetical protein